VASLITEGSRLLDLGCGSAGLLRTLYAGGKRNVRYVGVDRLQQCIRANQERYPEQQFFVIDFNNQEWPSLGGRFDVITMIALIEHFESPAVLLRSARDLLAEGGHVILTTPRRGGEGIYSAGVRLGLFSREAHEEHAEAFPDKPFLDNAGRTARLRLADYRLFMFGFNQLAIYRPL